MEDFQPVLIDDISFLSGADREPNSITTNSLESLFLILMFLFILTDLGLKIRKRKQEGQKYWQLIIALMFFSMLFVLLIALEFLLGGPK